MKRLLFTVGLLALAVGCPKIERKTYTFDVKKGEGTVRFVNIVTDDASKADGDFMEIVSKFVQGTELEEKNPGWRVGSKTLFEESGRLDGLVSFTFDDPAKAGLYKHDKKSPWIWCASRDESETVVATNGERLEPALPGCVAWDRKATSLEVTVKAGEMMGNERTLLPQFKRWEAGETLQASEDPFSGLLSGEGGGAGLDEDALAGQIMGSLGAAMGLSGTLTVGPPTVLGPMGVEDAERVLGDMARAQLQMCYQVTRAMEPALSGKADLHVAVDGGGEVSQAYLKGTMRGSTGEECILETVMELQFPAPGAEVEVVWPLTMVP